MECQPLKVKWRGHGAAQGREENLECDVLRAPVGVGGLGPEAEEKLPLSRQDGGSLGSPVQDTPNQRRIHSPTFLLTTNDALSKGLESLRLHPPPQHGPSFSLLCGQGCRFLTRPTRPHRTLILADLSLLHLWPLSSWMAVL